MKKFNPTFQRPLNALLLILLILVGSCNTDDKNVEEKTALLKADREAPLGWVYLTIYVDSTFEFISTGIRSDRLTYKGKVEIRNDTLFFAYSDSIPRAGKTAIISQNTVAYIDGQYYERLSISLPLTKP